MTTTTTTIDINNTTHGIEYVTGVLSVYETCDSWLDLAFHVENDGVLFSATCSDVFWWGTADTEPIMPDDLPLLRETAQELGEEYSDYLSDLFAARKRQMRPQSAYYRDMNPIVIELFNAAGPERAVDDPTQVQS